jgi:septal ring factor EnvC (AmiA/AmiB activator)
MDKSQRVSLGCGTLILIALIVLFLGNAGEEESRQEIKALRADVQRVQTLVESQSRQLAELERTLEALAQEVRAGSGPR